MSNRDWSIPAVITDAEYSRSFRTCGRIAQALPRRPAQLLLHFFTELLPSRDPGPRRFLVDTLRQSGNAHSTNETAVNGERHSATYEIDLARIHVHDAEVPVRAFLGEIGQDFRGLPQNCRSKRLAFGKASVVDCSTVHFIS